MAADCGSMYLEVLPRLVGKHEGEKEGVLVAIRKFVDRVLVRIQEPEILQHVLMPDPASHHHDHISAMKSDD